MYVIVVMICDTGAVDRGCDFSFCMVVAEVGQLPQLVTDRILCYIGSGWNDEHPGCRPLTDDRTAPVMLDLILPLRAAILEPPHCGKLMFDKTISSWSSCSELSVSSNIVLHTSCEWDILRRWLALARLRVILECFFEPRGDLVMASW